MMDKNKVTGLLEKLRDTACAFIEGRPLDPDEGWNKTIAYGFLFGTNYRDKANRDFVFSRYHPGTSAHERLPHDAFVAERCADMEKLRGLICQAMPVLSGPEFQLILDFHPGNNGQPAVVDLSLNSFNMLETPDRPAAIADRLAEHAAKLGHLPAAPEGRLFHVTHMRIHAATPEDALFIHDTLALHPLRRTRIEEVRAA